MRGETLSLSLIGGFVESWLEGDGFEVRAGGEKDSEREVRVDGSSFIVLGLSDLS